MIPEGTKKPSSFNTGQLLNQWINETLLEGSNWITLAALALSTFTAESSPTPQKNPILEASVTGPKASERHCSDLV